VFFVNTSEQEYFAGAIKQRMAELSSRKIEPAQPTGVAHAFAGSFAVTYIVVGPLSSIDFSVPSRLMTVRETLN
jgi:hypothetical protein